MDPAQLNISDMLSRVTQQNISQNRGPSTESKQIEMAKNFEAVFINKLLDCMQKTTEDWGFEQDSASKQVKSMFNMYLSQEIADQGGFGLWKDIYNNLQDLAVANNEGLNTQI